MISNIGLMPSKASPTEIINIPPKRINDPRLEIIFNSPKYLFLKLLFVFRRLNYLVSLIGISLIMSFTIVCEVMPSKSASGFKISRW